MPEMMPLAEIPAEDKTDSNSKTTCYHCSELFTEPVIWHGDKAFCCDGCKMVFEILSDNGLCQYYDLDEKAGVSLRGKSKAVYAFLEESDVVDRLVDFSDGMHTRVTFYIPQMHCASCIWLLENLYQLHEGVRNSSVNFTKKEAYITFENNRTSLRSIVELLADIGYEPAITLHDLEEDKRPLINRDFYYKLGVAGFAFGNIMLLSFPEYLGLEKATDGFFHSLFGYLNILLALPVLLYSGRDYFHSAWVGLRQRQLTIDFPLALGIAVLFIRSAIDIVSQTGAGFMDSLAGLVFFLLIGRWFQQKTYHHISFERDYKSYFPIAATLKKDGIETSTSLDKLKPGDVIIIRHKELIPADAVVKQGEASIDYSFVTGESDPVALRSGDKIFAGGRQMGATIEIALTRRVSQSYLTQLWNDEAFTKKTDSHTSQIANRIGRYFTVAILLVSAATLFYWLPRDTAIAFQAFTAVLIVACPCAVALAIPFIFGNVLRILARNKFFLKNTSAIESIVEAQAVVFDKTGTLTQRRDSQIWFSGDPLSHAEKAMLYALTAPSSHPISRSIAAWIEASAPEISRYAPKTEDWLEVPGKGVEARIGDKTIRLGAAKYMDLSADGTQPLEEGTWFQIDGTIRGSFEINRYFRPGTAGLIRHFSNKYPLYLLSGDNDRDRPLLIPMFGADERLKFSQSPHDKLQFIRALQSEKGRVMMLGDGLNDAGALQQSDIGIVLAEDTNNFTPACDAILQASSFHRLPDFVEFTRRSTHLVYYAYALAFVYNIIGLSFAVQGLLSPVVAAILMPASSITIVVFGMLASNRLAGRMNL
jgi:Cu+-exporting ATPase